jgi:iron(III)-enterobactin esterase
MAIGVAAMAQNAPQQPAATTPAPQEPAATTPAPQQPARGRGTPAPTRDPQTAGYVAATMLADGAVPPADAIGNFVIGPTHTPAPEMTAQPGVDDS